MSTLLLWREIIPSGRVSVAGTYWRLASRVLIASLFAVLEGGTTFPMMLNIGSAFSIQHVRMCVTYRFTVHRAPRAMHPESWVEPFLFLVICHDLVI